MFTFEIPRKTEKDARQIDNQTQSDCCSKTCEQIEEMCITLKVRLQYVIQMDFSTNIQHLFQVSHFALVRCQEFKTKMLNFVDQVEVQVRKIGIDRPKQFANSICQYSGYVILTSFIKKSPRRRFHLVIIKLPFTSKEDDPSQ